MIRVMVGSVGGLILAVLEVFLLWRDTQKVVRRRGMLSSGIFLRLLLSSGIIFIFLCFFRGDVILFVLSFSVVYFSLVTWLGMNWRDKDGRNI